MEHTVKNPYQLDTAWILLRNRPIKSTFKSKFPFKRLSRILFITKTFSCSTAFTRASCSALTNCREGRVRKVLKQRDTRLRSRPWNCNMIHYTAVGVQFVLVIQPFDSLSHISNTLLGQQCCNLNVTSDVTAFRRRILFKALLKNAGLMDIPACLHSGLNKVTKYYSFKRDLPGCPRSSWRRHDDTLACCLL